jgi:hypothetical protein
MDKLGLLVLFVPGLFATVWVVRWPRRSQGGEVVGVLTAGLLCAIPWMYFAFFLVFRSDSQMTLVENAGPGLPPYSVRSAPGLPRALYLVAPVCAYLLTLLPVGLLRWASLRRHEGLQAPVRQAEGQGDRAPAGGPAQDD